MTRLEPALARRAAILAGLGMALLLIGCAASAERDSDFPNEAFPRRRGTHGNGASSG